LFVFLSIPIILLLSFTKNLPVQTFTIESNDNIKVRAYCWLPEEKPVAVLQIAHGMQEHALRYDHFARWLNSKGFAVYANDHIGHGASINSMDEISHFPRKDDWQRSVDILHNLTLKIKSEHPGLPVFLLGHSMGSVLTQTYMMRYGTEASGYILSGAIRQPRLVAALGRAVVYVLSAVYGPESRSRLIVNLGYGPYNKHFKPSRTGADWLCSDDKTVDDYIASPLCGVPLTNMFYRNCFFGFSFIADPKNLRQIPSGKPIFIIAGESDPAGFFGKAPLKIKHLIQKHSKAKAELKLYPGFRHEILNEKKKEEVYLDVVEWIGKNISH
jgi:alpha-beta hydrolase superfamily lysophospholipase